jgi:thymidylate synthase (FAD)
MIGAEVVAETAGRICYMSFAKPRPGGNKAYLHHIKEAAHGSVFEHAVWTFIITGISRSLTHELVRHRAGFAFSQLSQRYVDESLAKFIVPRLIQENPEMYEIWHKAVTHAKEAYKQLVEIADKKALGTRKEIRQAVRSVLPNATETKIVVTANARALRHFIELRGSEHADAEMRALAIKLLYVMQMEAPSMFDDYKIVNGVITTQYKKI